MPSPIGHAIAGIAVGLACDPEVPQTPRAANASPWPWRFVFLCALVAILPDFDLALPKGMHRSFTHSFTAAVFVSSIAVLMTGEVTAKLRRQIGLMVLAAYLTHLLMDYLGVDDSTPSGMQLLWPFSHGYYLSGWNWFPPTERDFKNPAIWMINLRAFLTEVGAMTPIAIAGWWIRRTRKSRGPISVPDARPTPFAAAAGTDGISDRRIPREER